MSKILQSNFDFLKNLEKNNNRDWFNSHKDDFLKEKDLVISFADSLLIEMNKHDHIENESGKKCLHRIYRDVRFSKNKLPYKNNWPISFVRATKLLRGSYYVHIQPDNSFIGVGFWGPSPEDLKRIRIQFTMFGEEFKEILSNKIFKETFGEMQGSQLKNGPKGFDKNDPFIDLLKYKQFLFSKPLTDKEVLNKNFSKKVSEYFITARPFLNFFSEALITDTNGEPLF